jgi:hypothetical protein
MTNLRPEIAFVDVDDTLVRSASTNRVPITPLAERVRALKQAGATLLLAGPNGVRKTTFAREFLPGEMEFEI